MKRLRNQEDRLHKVGIVIPAFRVRNQIVPLLESIDSSIAEICVVDDLCPENTGKFVEECTQDGRVTVLYHNLNKGVGGAVKTGYTFLRSKNIEIIVKLDGDGQMNPREIGRLIQPIVTGQADYTKGNRFFSLTSVLKMPRIRLMGNILLSFLSKASSGYWSTFDPNNGFTAIHRSVLERIDLEKVSDRYFFESDLLFRLNLCRAKVEDVPMHAQYAGEPSSLNLWKASLEFPYKYFRNMIKRIFLVYFVQDFSLPSLQLIGGVTFMFSGSLLGISNFIRSQRLGIETPPGTLILFALLMFFGFQLLVGFLSYDVESVPKKSIIRKFPSSNNN
jgi:dolichol-phosphate mannosyltransferase